MRLTPRLDGTRPQGEGRVRLDRVQHRGANPRDAIQAGEGTEGTVRLAIRHDPGRESGTDAWQTGDFFRTCGIEIDPVAPGQRARQPTCLLSDSVEGAWVLRAGPVRDRARRTGGMRHQPHQDSGDSKQQEPGDGAAVRRSHEE